MQTLKWFVGALVLLAVACGEVSEPPIPVTPDDTGLLVLPLVSTSAGGDYKLVGATFSITGPQNATLTDTSAASVSVPLKAGTYTVQLNGGWHMERADRPGVTVPVMLVSPNPMTFTLDEAETLPVRFLFKVPKNGSETADLGGWISGTLVFEQPPAGSIFADMGGMRVPFVIGFESSTVTQRIESGINEVDVQTGPVTVQFGGKTTEEVQRRFVAPLQGSTLKIHMASTAPSVVYIEEFALENPAHGVRFALKLSSFVLMQDLNGYPIMKTAGYAQGAARLVAGGPELAVEAQDGIFSPW